MITHIGRVMTGRTETGKTCHPKRVVESRHARDIYRQGIEYFLATRHGSAILSRSPGPPMLLQASYGSKTNDGNGLPVGFPKEGGVPPGSGSLMPMKNPESKFASALGPPVAPAALR